VKWLPEQVHAIEFKTRTAARRRRAKEEQARIDQLDKMIAAIRRQAEEERAWIDRLRKSHG
jgi:hypothetical protein